MSAPIRYGHKGSNVRMTSGCFTRHYNARVNMPLPRIENNPYAINTFKRFYNQSLYDRCVSCGGDNFVILGVNYPVIDVHSRIESSSIYEAFGRPERNIRDSLSPLVLSFMQRK